MYGEVDNGEVDRGLALFVIEAGARWPRWGQLEARRRATSSVVDAQGSDESVAAFTRRVVERIESVRRSSMLLAYAAMITAPDSRCDPMSSRVQIARTIVSTLSASGGGSLVLAPSLPGSLSERDRHDLFALAGTLCEELSGPDVVVSVRLHGSRPRRQSLRWARSAPGPARTSRASRGGPSA
ncbi:MAG TPA: hypothetical protein VF989_00370 [Polyangiaceae bacterium]|jgi:hypothetical protein